jgi:hypothetical protein
LHQLPFVISVQLNCIAFIDFLMKNGNRDLLQHLQTSRSILAIGEDPIIRDGHVRGVLCQHARRWAAALSAARALHSQFAAWKERLLSVRYRNLLTQEVIVKFSDDFSAAFDLLLIFARAIAEAMREGGGAADPLVQEMLPSINELHTRLRDLRPTMSDEYALRIIAYLEEFCECAKRGYAALARDGTCDITPLVEIVKRGMPVPAVSPPVDLSAFEFADDVEGESLSKAEFALFIDQISKRTSQRTEHMT